MASYNKIILVGNLTRDPELSYTPANTAVCKFGLATNHKFKDRDGNMRESVCFVDCSVFGKSAETFNQYMKKGRPVLVEGRLDFQQWTSPEGDKRSKHAVFVENFTFLGGGTGEGDGSARSDGPARSNEPVAVASSTASYEPPQRDEIPF